MGGFHPSRLAAALLTNGNWYFGGETTVSFGNDHYNGAVYDENGNETPFQGNTHQTVVTINGKAGKGFAVGPSVMATPYFDAGVRFWKRNLSDGEREEYHHVETLVGGMLQYAPTDRLILSGYGKAGVTFGTHMRSYIQTETGTDALQYSMGIPGISKSAARLGMM